MAGDGLLSIPLGPLTDDGVWFGSDTGLTDFTRERLSEITLMSSIVYLILYRRLESRYCGECEVCIR